MASARVVLRLDIRVQLRRLWSDFGYGPSRLRVRANFGEKIRNFAVSRVRGWPNRTPGDGVKFKALSNICKKVNLDEFDRATAEELAWTLINKSLDTQKHSMAVTVQNIYLKICANMGELDAAEHFVTKVSKLFSQGERPSDHLIERHSNPRTYGKLIRACAVANRLDRAEFWVEEMKKNGMVVNQVICNTMVSAYAKYGNVEGALVWFHRAEKTREGADEKTYGALIHAYAQSGDLDNTKLCIKRWLEAGHVLDEKHNASLLTAVCRSGQYHEIVDTVEWLKKNGMKNDYETFAVIVGTVAILKRYDWVNTYLEEMKEQGYVPEVEVYINVFKKLADRAQSLNWLKTLSERGHGRSLSRLFSSSIRKHLAENKKAFYEYRIMIKYLEEELVSQAKEGNTTIAVDAFCDIIDGFAMQEDLNSVEMWHRRLLSVGLTPNRRGYSALLRLKAKVIESEGKYSVPDLNTMEFYFSALANIFPPDAEEFDSVLQVYERAARAKIGDDFRHFQDGSSFFDRQRLLRQRAARWLELRDKSGLHPSEASERIRSWLDVTLDSVVASGSKA
ncbi:hypothetical protein AAMO2058_000099900 [Amorphochlora amoebiformis]